MYAAVSTNLRHFLCQAKFQGDFVLRAMTHISQTLPKDLEHKIAVFHQEVATVFENIDFPLDYMYVHTCTYVCNMDKTLVFLDLVPSRVVDRKGKKAVNIRMTVLLGTACCSHACPLSAILNHTHYNVCNMDETLHVQVVQCHMQIKVTIYVQHA